MIDAEKTLFFKSEINPSCTIKVRGSDLKFCHKPHAMIVKRETKELGGANDPLPLNVDGICLKLVETFIRICNNSVIKRLKRPVRSRLMREIVTSKHHHNHEAIVKFIDRTVCQHEKDAFGDAYDRKNHPRPSKMGMVRLIRLLKAAVYLEMESLTDLCCAKFATTFDQDPVFVAIRLSAVTNEDIEAYEVEIDKLGRAEPRPPAPKPKPKEQGEEGEGEGKGEGQEKGETSDSEMDTSESE